VFRVNWFRTDKDTGKFLWPGFSDNLRVLKWVLDRTEGKAAATETVLGAIPTIDAIDTKGIVSPENMTRLLRVDPAEWVETVAGQEDFFNQFGDRLPQGIRDEHVRLSEAIEHAITPDDLAGRHY